MYDMRSTIPRQLYSGTRTRSLFQHVHNSVQNLSNITSKLVTNHCKDHGKCIVNRLHWRLPISRVCFLDNG